MGKIAKKVEAEAQKIEREKLKAVGMRNRLATEVEQARTRLSSFSAYVIETY